MDEHPPIALDAGQADLKAKVTCAPLSPADGILELPDASQNGVPARRVGIARRPGSVPSPTVWQPCQLPLIGDRILFAWVDPRRQGIVRGKLPNGEEPIHIGKVTGSSGRR